MAAPAVKGAGAAVTAIRSVLLRVRRAAEQSGRSPERVRVVAVSKTKPVYLIRQVHDAGHFCFVENYVKEIVDKAPQLPEDTKWHFVGHLQSNKVKTLLGCVGLAEHVKMRCPNLEFSGLMTIGMPDYTSTPANFRIEIGSTNVRIGSTIFGPREYAKKQ